LNETGAAKMSPMEKAARKSGRLTWQIAVLEKESNTNARSHFHDS
jgi:hypothetical protein